MVASVGLFRPVVLEGGARLASEAKIGKPDDAFFLTFADFSAWVGGKAGAARDVESQAGPADVILDGDGLSR